MGSEMCIRDSYSIDAGCGAIDHSTFFQIPAWRSALDSFGELDRCLLYTSDAADERSSVDLGGRRIIKKKKQEHQVVENRDAIIKISHTRET